MCALKVAWPAFKAVPSYFTQLDRVELCQWMSACPSYNIHANWRTELSYYDKNTLWISSQQWYAQNFNKHVHVVGGIYVGFVARPVWRGEGPGVHARPLGMYRHPRGGNPGRLQYQLQQQRLGVGTLRLWATHGGRHTIPVSTPGNSLTPRPRADKPKCGYSSPLSFPSQTTLWALLQINTLLSILVITIGNNFFQK